MVDKYEQYKLLIQARNFHFDNYNKWMTYFYVAMAAFFIGYYTMVTSSKNQDLTFEIITLLIIGYITSLFWYLSSKGYYYWNINFIKLINHFEEQNLKLKKEERVYYIFADKKAENNIPSPINGANFSTSKITIFFAYIITLFWNNLLFKNLLSPTNNCDYLLYFILSLLMTLIFSGVFSLFLKSDIKSMPELDKKEGT